jgi:hypothetical protein
LNLSIFNAQTRIYDIMNAHKAVVRMKSAGQRISLDNYKQIMDSADMRLGERLADKRATVQTDVLSKFCEMVGRDEYYENAVEKML